MFKINKFIIFVSKIFLLFPFVSICVADTDIAYKNKRLLIISDCYEGQIGGTEKVISEIKNRLEKKGVMVFFMDLSKVETFEMPGMAGERSPYPFKVKSEVAEVIRNFNPDYILIIPLGIMSFQAANFCYEKKIPFTIFYSTLLPEIGKAVSGVPICITRYFVNNFLLKKAKNVLVPSNSLWDQLTVQGVKNVITWPHGIDLEKFQVPTLEEKELATKTCDLQKSPRPFYLFVGHLSARKNLNAFLELKIPGTKILVGGENVGFDLNLAKKKYPEVIFPGPKQGNDLLNYYKCADIFLFPSKTDTFGLVLLEALASGLPIVGFDVIGTHDVAPKGCGVSYLAQNDQELQICALQAWEDLKKGVVTSDQCREYSKRFSWDTATDELLKNLIQIDFIPQKQNGCCSCSSN